MKVVKVKCTVLWSHQKEYQ